MKVAWNMTLLIYEQYLEHIEKLATLDPDYDYEEYQEVSYSLAMLPNFPTNARLDEDIIVPVLPINTPPLVALNINE